ncbi:hypothetical protein D8780_13350 [Notoacmeibacter ruber]|uniref:C-type lysozyme inhibitor domain-containing protein n=1 Tax=Notoacmeibacter ruber TaxID=2670375 RepID=A0A3L7JE71_9HYPH|nr:hypothetical protein D8780_13350 [Notoacmeibacter ruber]
MSLGLVGLLSLLAACSTAGGGAGSRTSFASDPSGRFRCDGGTAMDVRRAGGGAVSVTSPLGEQIVLPASPPGQMSRYGENAYALVIEGPDALFMKQGEMPVNCRR